MDKWPNDKSSPTAADGNGGAQPKGTMNQETSNVQSGAAVACSALLADVESALSEYPKVPREVWIGTDSPVDKVRWLARRCDGSDRTISRLHDEKRELLQLLKSVHSWFMEKAPEHYNGCGLWIDVDITLRESANERAMP